MLTLGGLDSGLWLLSSPCAWFCVCSWLRRYGFRRLRQGSVWIPARLCDDSASPNRSPGSNANSRAFYLLHLVVRCYFYNWSRLQNQAKVRLLFRGLCAIMLPRNQITHDHHRNPFFLPISRCRAEAPRLPGWEHCSPLRRRTCGPLESRRVRPRFPLRWKPSSSSNRQGTL